MHSAKTNNTGLLVAVVIASGAIAAGAVSVAVAQEQAGPQSLATSTTMSVGSTGAETTPSP